MPTLTNSGLDLPGQPLSQQEARDHFLLYVAQYVPKCMDELAGKPLQAYLNRRSASTEPIEFTELHVWAKKWNLAEDWVLDVASRQVKALSIIETDEDGKPLDGKSQVETNRRWHVLTLLLVRLPTIPDELKVFRFERDSQLFDSSVVEWDAENFSQAVRTELEHQLKAFNERVQGFIEANYSKVSKKTERDLAWTARRIVGKERLTKLANEGAGHSNRAVSEAIKRVCALIDLPYPRTLPKG